VFTIASGSHTTDPDDGSPYAPALVERLLAVIAGINADLDHDVVLGRICHACVDLIGAEAAGFISFDDDGVRFTTGIGFPNGTQAVSVPAEDPELLSLASDPRRIILADAHRQLAHRPDLLAALAGLNTVVVTPVLARGRVAGALVVAFTAVGQVVRSEQWTLLDLLAGHGGAAVANDLAFEDALRRQAHEIAVIDAVADGVATLDAAGCVVSWNRAAAELTGLTARQVAGRPLPFPAGGPDRPAEHQLGEGRWLEIVATPLEGGQVVVLHDISRQKALDAAKAMFVAATSHELKTPLTVIRSFADWLRDHGETAEAHQRKTAYDAIADGADELYQLVEKVLLTAKTEAGRVDLSLRRVDPERLVRAAAGPFLFPDGRHDVRLELDASLPAIWADQQALHTVLGQLLENAVKYSPDGGVVTVRAHRARHGDHPEREMVRFAVRDQGIGLAPIEIQHLFTPFYQGEARSGVRGGVGLGLSIVRRLVEHHGGECGASGEPGRGAEFWFSVPVARPDQDDLV